MPLETLAIPTLVAALAIFIPGGLVAAVLRLRGGLALAVAPAASIALISVAGLLTGFTPLAWGPGPVVLVTMVGVLLALGIRLLVPRFPVRDPIDHGAWSGPREWLTLAAVGVGATLNGWALLQVFGRGDAFSQTFDNYFHMALVRSFLEDGVASPFVLSNFGDPESARGFYPAAWHQVVALVSGTTGAGVPEAQNAVTLAVACIVWPLAAVFLARSIVQARALVLLGSGVLAGGFSLFPFLPLEYGVLYPFFMGVALVPVALGLLIQALRLGTGERLHPLVGLAVTALVLVAVSMAHPNALLVILSTGLALGLAATVRVILRGVRREATPRRVLVAIALFLVSALVVATLWYVLRPPYWTWPQAANLQGSLWQFLFHAPFARSSSIPLAILFVAGVVAVLWRRRHTYVLLPAAVILILWVVAAAFPPSSWRHWIVGGFYDDPFRLATLMPLALLLVVVVLFDALDSAFSQLEPNPRAVAVAGTLAALLFATQFDGHRDDGVRRMAGTFAVYPESTNITPDELEMLEDLPEFVGSDEVVLADPKTGAALMFPLQGLTPTQFHPNDPPSPAEALLLDHFMDPTREIAVCHAVEVVGTQWILDFGTDQINMELEHEPPAGLQRLEDSPLLTLTHKVGQTRLFEITGCP